MGPSGNGETVKTGDRILAGLRHVKRGVSNRPYSAYLQVNNSMSTTRYVDVDRALDLLKQDVHPENEAAVRDFVDHQAAEDISELQQHRQVYSLQMLLTKFAPEGFRLRDATEDELKQLMARMNRSDYAASTKEKMEAGLKKFYKVENGGEYPDKAKFIKVSSQKDSPVTREDIFTDDELTELLNHLLVHT